MRVHSQGRTAVPGAVACVVLQPPKPLEHSERGAIGPALVSAPAAWIYQYRHCEPRPYIAHTSPALLGINPPLSHPTLG